MKSKYQKHFTELIYECVTDKFMYLKDIAKVMGVNYDTLNDWLKVGSKYFKSELSIIELYINLIKDTVICLIYVCDIELYNLSIFLICSQTIGEYEKKDFIKSNKNRKIDWQIIQCIGFV